MAAPADRFADWLAEHAGLTARTPRRAAGWRQLQRHAARRVGPDGAAAPTRPMTLVPPTVPKGALGIRLTASLGDYRAGDELWCDPLPAERFAEALNRDVLVPRPAGRFCSAALSAAMGRCSTCSRSALARGNRWSMIPPWIAMPVKLVRGL